MLLFPGQIEQWAVQQSAAHRFYRVACIESKKRVDYPNVYLDNSVCRV